MTDTVIQKLRRGPVQGMAVLYVSTDGTGTKLTVPTEIGRELGNPAELVISVARIEEPLTEEDDPITAALDAEEQGEAQGVADALAAAGADGGSEEE